jgi:DNA-binding NtrC family response regulator
MPALRERPEDVPLLIEHFLRKNGESAGVPVTPSHPAR